MSNFESVKKFMQTFGQEIKTKASFPNDKITKLRIDRIAQMVLCPVIRIELEEVKDLPKTIRGEGGFGSTGK